MSEWINVNYHLPPSYIKVLIFTVDNEIEISMRTSNDYIKSGGVTWFNPDINKAWFYEEVTHWMPLPENPITDPRRRKISDLLPNGDKNDE